MEASLVYDGSFEGFLSAVFIVYDRRISHSGIYDDPVKAPALFSPVIMVDTNEAHASRVWKRFKEKVSAQSAWNFYASFLSELPGIEDKLLGLMQYVFANTTRVDDNFANASVLQISQVAKMVHGEKHRMEAFVRFKLMQDGIYYAAVEPDFNVLPLISEHFTSRYADQQWIIYDLRRHYGLHYDLHQTHSVTIEFSEMNTNGLPSETLFNVSEENYQQLWKTYFKNVNIPSRKNMKLHLRHVPKRYWKLLIEKMP